jgi:hypothetical protein
MNFGRVFLSVMTLIQSLPSHLWISALASFGVVQRFRLEKTHQKEFHLADQSVCEYSLSMNSVAPYRRWAHAVRSWRGQVCTALVIFSRSASRHLTPKRTSKHEMVELPVGSKPGWELEQADPDQEESPPLKSVADRSASFILVLVLSMITCPWLTHWPAFSFSIH